MDTELIEQVVSIAQSAGERILEVYQRPFEVESKGDGSPLTEADRAAHQLITHSLAGLTAEIPVLSEESSSNTFDQRRTWQRFWLVDPLDGTREFVKKNGEFTVNIALIDGSTPVFGVVHAPVLGTTYHGSTAGGAWRSAGGAAAEQVSTRKLDPDRICAVASRSHRTAEVDAFLSKIARRWSAPEIRSMGSSLKLCLVADGSADVYPRMGPTSEWDTAAAHAVVTAAGGTVTDVHGEPLRYNKEDILNPWFIAAGDPSIDWPLLVDDKG